MTISLLALLDPARLWGLYVHYLWRYERGSWVEWAASCARALALAVVAPFANLTMLVRGRVAVLCVVGC